MRRSDQESEMKTVGIITATLLLTACGTEHACIEGRVAYKYQNMWITPDGAYRCEVSK
jgi:major membrane immunogen (membrane-anchored lipoprotein)